MRISEYDELLTPADADFLPIVHEGVTYKIQLSLIQAISIDTPGGGGGGLADPGGPGLVVRDSLDHTVPRSLVGPAVGGGLTISNPNGVGGNPTFALANDLAALEALTGAGYAKRAGPDSWTLTATIPVGDLPPDLAALEALTGAGYAKRTGPDSWTLLASIPPADLPGGFVGFGNPTTPVGLVAVNGSAFTAMRSDGAPALNQGISPTMTGSWIFNQPVTIGVAGSVVGKIFLRSTTGTLTIQAANASGDWGFSFPTGTGAPGYFMQTDGTGISSWVTRTITAGGGLTGGGNLTADRTIAMGTPTSLSATSTNAATGATHEHIIDATIARSAILINAGVGLTGGGDLTASRTIAMGTPTSLSATSINTATGTTHAHAIDATIARSAIIIAAGVGLTGGGDLTADRTIAMGVPSSLSATSINAATGTTHAHVIDATIARSAIRIDAGVGLLGGGDLTANRVISMGTPSDLSVISVSSAVTGTHAHAIISSSNPGATASILATNASGYLQLVRLGIGLAPTQPLEVGGNVFINAATANLFMKDLSTGFQVAATTVITPQANNSIRSTSFTAGLAGWNVNAIGDAEFNNVIIRGALRASVFVVNEISATAGTFGVFYSAATLTADATTPGAIASSFQFTAKNSDAGLSLFQIGDVVRMKAFVSFSGTIIGDAWATITARTNNGATTTYTARMESGSTATTFRAGTAVADYGPSGFGFITLSSDGTVGASPNMTMAKHAGAPWSSQTLLNRVGNLNGSYGYANDTYGFATGQYGVAGQSWIIAAADAGSDPTKSGIRLGNNTTTLAQWDTSGNITIGEVSAGKFNTLISAGALAMRVNVTSYFSIDTSGNVTFGNVATNQGNAFWNNSNKRLEFRGGTGGTTVATYIDTTGAIKAGNGVVTIDQGGIVITQGSGSVNQVRWLVGFEQVGYIRNYDAGVMATEVLANSISATNASGGLAILGATNSAAKSVAIGVYSYDSASGGLTNNLGYVAITATAGFTFRGLTIGTINPPTAGQLFYVAGDATVAGAFSVSGSLTANAITVASLTTSGNIGVGFNTGGRVDIYSNAYVVRNLNLGGTTESYWLNNFSKIYFGAQANWPLIFITNNLDRMTIDAGGNVGIGITPSYKVHVKETAADGRTLQSEMASTTGTNYAGLFMATGVGPTSNTGLYIEASGAATNRAIYIAQPGAGSNNYAIFSSSPAKSYFAGHIGIGVTDGSYALMITGQLGGGSTRIYLSPATTTDYAVIQFTNAGGSSFIGIDNSSAGVFGVNAYTFGIMHGANSSFAIATNGVSRLVLSATGAMRLVAYGAGTLVTDVSGNVTASSDERLKNIERVFTRGLADLRATRAAGSSPVVYRWREGFDTDDTETEYVGWTTQSLQATIPEAVFEGRKFQNLWDRAILATHDNAIIELDDGQINLRTRIEDLERELANLRARLN